MKKHVVLLLMIAGVLLVSATMVMAGTNPGTGIKQTSHDLSSTGKGDAWGAGTAADATLDRICIYCHAPHHTYKDSVELTNKITYFPLWNHDLTQEDNYTLYKDNDGTDEPGDESHKLNAELTQPGSISKLCLSCHDGSVAVSNYGNFNDLSSSRHNTGTKTVTGSSFAIGEGADLSNHHPIGFDYEYVSIADDEINPPDTYLLGANPNGLYISDLLYGGKMECASCHDVHNTKNEGTKFTWVKDEHSDFCLSCHTK